MRVSESTELCLLVTGALSFSCSVGGSICAKGERER